ncbi:hypothetical protein LX36DRAFT_695013 [Colletotrichum falcatum]|nr:hypothetical protein LX36DRAFT_695013 [Colletotrichum falcatum]
MATTTIEITKFCHHYQLNSKAPGRFKFTLKDNHEFNHEIYVDVVYLNSNQPTLHVVDSATALNFHATEFKRATQALSIEVKEVPIKAHNSVRKVKRYHAALRRVYAIIHAKTGAKSKVALQLAVKAINDTAGPDGLMPTLLKKYTRFTQKGRSMTHSQRATAQIQR